MRAGFVTTARRRPHRPNLQLLPRRRARAALLRERLERYLDERARAPRAARRRGARLPRDARLRHPAHLGAPADGRGAGRGDGDDRPPRARRARRGRRRPALERRADASRRRAARTGRRRAARSPPACRSRASWRAAAASSPSAASRTPRSAGRTSATRPTAARPRSPPGCVGCSRERPSTAGMSVVTAMPAARGGLVFLSGMIQLAVALGTVTLVARHRDRGDPRPRPGRLPASPAPLAVGPAGRISDRFGRMPVIRTGFVLGIGRAAS